MVREKNETGSTMRSKTTSQARIAELYMASKLGPTGRQMTFDTFKVGDRNEQAYAVAKAWAGSYVNFGSSGVNKQGVMLYGPRTGCGKTHLACAVANHLIQAGVLAVFVPTVMIPRNNQDAILEMVDPQDTPVLILDDLGAEKPTPRLLECLYTIVERRLWLGAPTIVTTNMHPQHIRKYGTEGGYGDKLYSRLMAMCECVPVDGPDRRL